MDYSCIHTTNDSITPSVSAGSILNSSWVHTGPSFHSCWPVRSCTSPATIRLARPSFNADIIPPENWDCALAGTGCSSSAIRCLSNGYLPADSVSDGAVFGVADLDMDCIETEAFIADGSMIPTFTWQIGEDDADVLNRVCLQPLSTCPLFV